MESEALRPSDGDDEVLLSAEWADVSQEFWKYQQKQAVEFFHSAEPIMPDRSDAAAPGLFELPLQAVGDSVIEDVEDGQRLSREALLLLAIAADMFISELSLKTWHFKSRSLLALQSSEPVGVSRGDVAFAVMHTEELNDWMVAAVMPEFQSVSKLVDPSRLHVGFFKVIDVASFRVSHISDADTELVQGHPPSSPNLLDLWLQRDYDHLRDKVVFAAQVSLQVGSIQIECTGRVISLPDGTHGIRAILPNGRLDISFANGATIKLQIEMAERELNASFVCGPLHSDDASSRSESASHSASESADEGVDDSASESSNESVDEGSSDESVEEGE